MKREMSICMIVAVLLMITPFMTEKIPSVKGEVPRTEIDYWQMDMGIDDVSSASFIGETSNDGSGSPVCGVGDVNGDGYDDFIIGAQNNNEGGLFAGQTYLLLGKASGLTKCTALSTADASFIGEFANDMSGTSVSGAGDVNGDGLDDILIGANRNDEGGLDAGQTYLFLGRSTGWTMDMDLSSADASFIGENGGDKAGSSLSGAGDVNGDGLEDILIGATGNGEGGLNSGQTYLVLGRTSGWSMDMDLSSANASFIGEALSDFSGFSVSGVGDVNGDSIDDILIGARENEEGGEEAGQTYLFFGRTSGWSMDMDLSSADASFIGEAINDHSGNSLSGAGDVNGDGFNDILIAARDNNPYGSSDAGQTYLILGRPSDWSMDVDLSSANASFIGETSNDYSGNSVSGAGDVNGDGLDDIIIGAYGNAEGGSNSGQTYLVLGRTSGWSMDMDLSLANASFIGETSNDRSGYSVSGAGDVDNDGFNDLLIGANGKGQTYLIEGIDNIVLEKDNTPSFATTGDMFTFSVKINRSSLVPEMTVEYWFGNGLHVKNSMENIDNQTWNLSIVIPSTSIERLFYNFSFPIHSVFWRNTSISNVTILDNDKPEFGPEFTDTEAYTDDPFLFSSDVMDNIDVKAVKVDYWFESGDHSTIDAIQSFPGRWEKTITVPSDYIGPLYYEFTSFDEAGNSNGTSVKNVTVYDNDPPEIVDRTTIDSLSTGDEMTFSVRATDNIDVSSVFLEFAFGGDEGQNISLEKGSGSDWEFKTSIQDREYLQFRFHAVDDSGNWNHTTRTDVMISDDDPPQFGEDSSDVSATTGENFTFSIEITDNIGLTRPYANYWTKNEERIKVILIDKGLFTSTIDIPSNWTEFSYTFHVQDTSNNYLETEPVTIEVLDNDPPIIEEYKPEDSCWTGMDLPISVEASDNIGILKAVVEYWFGTSDHQVLDLKGTGHRYNGSISIPIDSLGPLFYNIKVFDTSDNVNSTITFEVTIVDSISPVLEPVEDITVYIGDEINVTLITSDNIGIVSISWVGSPIDAEWNTLSGIANEVGDFIIQVLIKDGEGNTNYTAFTLTVLALDHDEDTDGIPDLIEIRFGLDIYDRTDATEDLDNDGLSNLDEFKRGTEMNDSDTDDDGFLDGYEVENGYDPLDPSSGKGPEGPDEEGSNAFVWIVLIVVMALLIMIVAASVAFVLIRKKNKERTSEDATAEVSPKATTQSIPPVIQGFSRPPISLPGKPTVQTPSTLPPPKQPALPAAASTQPAAQVVQAPQPVQAPIQPTAPQPISTTKEPPSTPPPAA